MTFTQHVLLYVSSLLLVALGQPAWVWWSGLIASVIGYTMIWKLLLYFPKNSHRFWLGTLWFMSVQLVQLSWLIAHPYLYIYIIYFLLSFAIGLQFGLFSLLVRPNNLQSVWKLIAISCCWVLLEWIRLFLLSGFSWNPVGLALTGSIYPMQMASIWGVYGLSFWVIFVNLLALRVLIDGVSASRLILFIIAAILPYIYGWCHIAYHESHIKKTSTLDTPFKAVLVQTAFPIEENLEFKDLREYVDYVFGEWHTILTLLKKQQGVKIDLIALPEYVVPFGTYYPVFRYDAVVKAFQEVFGADSISKLPQLQPHLGAKIDTPEGPVLMVNNAFWAQGISNVFQSDLILGLEDSDQDEEQNRINYNAALFFWPHCEGPKRYAKRVLVPMGEYIPFKFCKDLAAKYGVTGSFTCGEEAVVMKGNKSPFGLSICYEETYGDLMRGNRQKGAEMLINLTSDIWYPHSRLPKQHLDHALLRTVENGIPLLRACNTGITCGIDSLGRIVAELGVGAEDPESVADSLYVALPTYHYHTLYSRLGDSLIIGISVFAAIFFFLRMGL